MENGEVQAGETYLRQTGPSSRRITHQNEIIYHHSAFDRASVAGSVIELFAVPPGARRFGHGRYGTADTHVVDQLYKDKNDLKPVMNVAADVDILDDDEGGQHRLIVEERLLLMCVYIRALKKEHLVKAVLGEAPPIRGATEYGDLLALHKELRDELAKRPSCYQLYTKKQKDYIIPLMKNGKRVLPDPDDDEDPEDPEDPANGIGPEDEQPYQGPEMRKRLHEYLSKHAKG